MSDGAETFVSFTGASLEQAEQFLQMSGGDVEAAVGLFFGTQDGMVDAPAAPAADGPADAGMTGVVPSWWDTIWPAQETPPDAWRQQGLDSGSDGWPGGIVQPKNGPCGVLAALHALILAEQHSCDPAHIRVTPEATADAVFAILCHCRPAEDAPLRLVRPRDRGSYGPAAPLDEVALPNLEAARAEIRARADDFRGPGGIIDLLYSAVFTRGLDQVQREAVAEGGELPLVTRAFNCWLCTTELLSLLLRGSAMGNVGAFRADGSRNDTWDGARVGVLSKGEKEAGIPIADALKDPRCPVWILHGGDHFTVAWARALPPTGAGARFSLFHWNGLPPGGPRLTELAVAAPQGATAGAKEVPKYYKPAPGEVDEVIQADPDDKKECPGQYRRWRYEVLLAYDDPTVQGEARPAGMPSEPQFDQNDPRYQRPGAWRCRLCYAKRFQTMDFNLVPADTPDWCPKCQKSRKECGWSLWMPFTDLPASKQVTVLDRHCKKVESILWTKWPAAEISAVEGGLPDC